MLSAFPHIHVSVTGMQLQFSKSWREKTGEAKQKRGQLVFCRLCHHWDPRPPLSVCWQWALSLEPRATCCHFLTLMSNSMANSLHENQCKRHWEISALSSFLKMDLLHVSFDNCSKFINLSFPHALVGKCTHSSCSEPYPETGSLLPDSKAR